MKVQHKKNKKILLIVIIGLALLLVAALLLIVWCNQKPITHIPPTDTNAQNLNAKQNLIKNPDSQDAPTPPASNSDSIVITSTQTTTDVTIFTQLSNIASGSCNLQITNAAKTYTTTAPVIYQSQFSTCAGFTVSKNSLNGSGTWNVVLVVNNGKNNITKTATIEVN